MNATLTHVPLIVSDQNRALHHYTTKVGFEKRDAESTQAKYDSEAAGTVR
jgi:hypothetical protein